MLLSKEILYYDFGDFRLDVRGERLLKDGRPVTLTHKAFLTLLILVRNAGRIVEKEEIISEIWGDSFVEESNLSQYVYVLRKILGSDPNGNPYIETVTRRGFRFTAEVAEVRSENKSDDEVLSSKIINDRSVRFERNLNGNGFGEISVSREMSTPDKSPAVDAPAAADPGDVNPPAAAAAAVPLSPEKVSPKNNQSWFRFLLLAVLSLGLIPAGVYVYKNRQAPAKTVDSKTKSIAVLPFKTIGEESNSEKLGFGMADAVITRLGRAKQIPVRPTSAIFQFTDANSTDSVAIGRQLRVDAVLEGTIQRDAERVRVSVSLINVGDGVVLWADTFDEKFTNIFALQDSISDSVAKSLSINLTPQEKNVRQPTTHPEAYQAYLLGVYFWNKRTKEDLEKGVVNFQRAIDLDPNYAQAYAGLADCYNLLGYYRHSNRDEMRAKARAAAEKALALNDSLAEAHIAMAFVQSDMEKARHFLERAIELAPYNSTARVRYGWNLLRDGAPQTLELVEKQMRLAQEYDPLSIVSNGALCSVLMFRRNYDEAVKYCGKTVELAPQSTQSRLGLADALFFKGQHEEAIAAAKLEAEKGQHPEYALGTLGHYYAMLGRRGEAEKILAELKPKAEKDTRLLLDLILISSALGRRSESIGYFRQAYEKKALPRNMSYDPIWQEVVKDPEIKKILG